MIKRLARARRRGCHAQRARARASLADDSCRRPLRVARRTLRRWPAHRTTCSMTRTFTSPTTCRRAPTFTSTWKSWATRSAARRSSAYRCSRPGRTRTPAISRPRTICSQTRRCTTTPSRTPYIARAYQSLPREQQARLDPMITGFNPADMYAVDHIRRVLETVSWRVLRHRRVHDPQGVRLRESRRRHGEPYRSGARSHPGFRRAKLACR